MNDITGVRVRIWLPKLFTSNIVYVWHVMNQRLNFGTPHGKKKLMQNFKHIVISLSLLHIMSDPDAPAHNSDGTLKDACEIQWLHPPSDEQCTISLDDPKSISEPTAQVTRMRTKTTCYLFQLSLDWKVKFPLGRLVVSTSRSCLKRARQQQPQMGQPSSVNFSSSSL